MSVNVKSCYQRLPYRVIVLWIVVIVLFCSIFTIDKFKEYVPHNSVVVGNGNSGNIDGIVFIAMGSLAAETITDNSIASVRKIGKWTGNIYVITDTPQCFGEVQKSSKVTVIAIPPVKNIIEIKSIKTKLFSHLPDHVNSILYMDVDILVNRRLDLFLVDLNYHLDEFAQKAEEPSTKPDLGLFLDSGGHFFGFCAGCDRWHTGVIWLSRNAGQACLQSWEEILNSGKYDTDQQSIDDAYYKGSCKNILALPPKHLLFAKDYFALLFSPSRTFIHLTAVNRIDTQDMFYKNYVVPYFKSSIKSQGVSLKMSKVCAPENAVPDSQVLKRE